MSTGVSEQNLLPPEYSLAYPNVESGLDLAPRLSSPRVYHADAVVVGSGAGGAPVAARLRDAGLDVLLLEEGGLYRTADFVTDPLESARRMYRDAGTSLILGQPPITFAEGRCVGGSTVINGGMSWRTPGRVLQHWDRKLGLDGCDEKSMQGWFEQAERILTPETQHPETIGKPLALFADAARRKGWDPVDNQRNMHRCMGLNNCAFGCPTGAKRSMLVTEIPRALAAGAQLVTNARVDRVLKHRRRVAGVAGSFVDLHGRRQGRFEVRARLVVLAAGARNTPGLLLRSRLRGPMTGRGLHVHPNAKVVGLFDQPLDSWAGTHQAHQVHRFMDEGILMAAAGVPPGILAAGIPGLGEEHGRLMARYNHMLTAGCLVEDSGQGRVRLGPDRRPLMTFKLSSRDLEVLHRGVRLLAEGVFEAGAERVLLPFADLPLLQSADELEKIDQRPRSPQGLELMTVHIMGSCRMAVEERHGPCDPWGRVRGIEGLAVADASVIPSPVGLNPMQSIVALALRNCERWIEGFKRQGGNGAVHPS